MNYIPINIKTNYSLLSSLIRLDDLMCFAKNNNIDTIGITDTNMFGTLEFYNKCIINDIKPIIGTEININDKSILLYAKDFDGYKNLCRIVTKYNNNELDIDFLKKYNQNIICVHEDNIETYNLTSSIFKEVFISYKNQNEKNNALLISKNIVFSNEIRYLNQKDEEYLEYLYMIKNGETVSNHKEYNFDSHYYLNQVNESDILTTKNFSDLINFELPKFDFVLPKYSDNSKELLISLSKKGLKKRLNENINKIYVDRLLYELKVIEEMGFIDYFLIVYDYVLYAKKNNIVVGPGRGSAAGSLVCYSLGITDIDPIKYNLIFERFLNPGRVTMPDIDIDFEFQRRDEVVEYVRNKYGKENVCNIITFGTLLPKQVLRDVGRILEINLSTIDRLCKQVGFNESFSDLKNNQKFMSEFNNIELKKLLEISYHLENLKRHTSIHAAGVVIGGDSLTNKMPLYNSGSNILTSYTMEYMEQLGLLKMDFLALRNLTIIDSVNKSLENKIDLSKIPLNDSKAIKLFNEVNMVGIFQFESEGMKSFLRKYKITSFDDIISALALYRPGPKDMIPEYIRRKNYNKKIDYIVPELESILNNTYGIIIYQEQIIEILKVIGNYSYSEADNIRRAMSKKKESIILKEKETFIERSTKNGIDKNKALEIYDLILKFANYGFNKAHSVAYSFIAYQMAYLKAHYTSNFMISLLNIVIGREIKVKEYIEESKVLGLEFDFVNINKSTNIFYINNNKKIVYPLSIIKGLGNASISQILKERENGIFIDYYDFIRRVYGGSVNKKILECLIDSGALSSFNYNKKTMKENLDEMINYAILCKDLDESLVLKPEIIIKEEYSESDLISIEYNTYGFYINSHPTTKYKRNNIRIKDIKLYFDKNIEVIALIENIKTINTKKGDKMSFITISDETSKVDSILFPKLYNEIVLTKGNVVKIFGKVEKRMNDYQIIINRIEVL